MTPEQPGPSGLAPPDSRNWAMGAHLSALAAAFIGGVGSFVGPLVVWLVRRDTDAFAAGHALEALNFNLTILGVAVIAGLLALVTLGLGLIVAGPVWGIAGILWLIFTIQASMAASRGEVYRYPISVRLIKG